MKKSIRKKAPLPPSEQNSLREVKEEVETKQQTSESYKAKYSSDESSEEEDARHMEGNVYTKAGMEVSIIFECERFNEIIKINVFIN